MQTYKTRIKYILFEYLQIKSKQTSCFLCFIVLKFIINHLNQNTKKINKEHEMLIHVKYTHCYRDYQY